MTRRKMTGILIFCSCIVGFFVYAYLLMLSEWSPIVLQLSVLMIAGGLLGVISWIGYMMATTKPSPSSILPDDK
ncbi:MAG: transcriptional regulator [Thermoproteota archaeon]